MKQRWALLVACFLAAGVTLAGPVKLEATASPLEGSRFDLKIVPDEAAARLGEKAFDDSMVFAGGKLVLLEGEKLGFQASPYSLTTPGPGMLLRAEQTSPRQGKSVWSAEIRDETIRGRLTRTRKDGIVLEYTFDGKKVQK